MNLSAILNESAILPDLKVSSKKALLRELARLAQDQAGIDHQLVFERILERERLGSTGVGSGVAIPHGKFPELNKMIAIFARLDTKIDYDSLDDEPVDLVFLLLSPEDVGSDHLQTLAMVSRLMRDKAFCDKLRGSNNAQLLHGYLTNAPQPVTS